MLGLVIIVYHWGVNCQNIRLRTLLCLERGQMEVFLLPQKSMLIVNCLFPSLVSSLDWESRDVGSTSGSTAK